MGGAHKGKAPSVKDILNVVLKETSPDGWKLNFSLFFCAGVMCQDNQRTKTSKRGAASYAPSPTKNLSRWLRRSNPKHIYLPASADISKSNTCCFGQNCRCLLKTPIEVSASTNTLIYSKVRKEKRFQHEDQGIRQPNHFIRELYFWSRLNNQDIEIKKNLQLVYRNPSNQIVMTSILELLLMKTSSLV